MNMKDWDESNSLSTYCYIAYFIEEDNVPYPFVVWPYCEVDDKGIPFNEAKLPDKFKFDADGNVLDADHLLDRLYRISDELADRINILKNNES